MKEKSDVNKKLASIIRMGKKQAYIEVIIFLRSQKMIDAANAVKKHFKSE